MDNLPDKLFNQEKENITKSLKLKKESREKNEKNESYWKVLIVDDDMDILTLTKITLSDFILHGKKIKFLFANSSKEAKKIMKKHNDIAFIMLDVVMEEKHAGLKFVKFVREDLDNSIVRIMIRTGFPGEAPEDMVIGNYDISDYKIKNEITPIKIVSSLTIGLRDYENLMILHKANEQLKEENIKLINDVDKIVRKKNLDLFANLSHEIRTPVNGILGFSNLLKKENITKNKISEYTKNIESCASQLKNIINNIIDYTKIDTNKLTVKKKEFDINKMLYELKSLLSFEIQIAGKENIKLNIICSKNEQILISDEYRIRQVIINLFNNALKNTKQGYIEIGYMYKENKSKTVIYVKDTGSGIKQKDKKYIFRKHKQFGDKKEDMGFGLGLPICKGIVSLLNGEIWFDSTYNKGSTFYFSFINYQQYKGRGNIQKSIKKAKILVVDDDEISLLFLEELLAEWEADAYLAKDGEEALELIDNNPEIQLVLMDIKLPGKSGVEIMKIIKRIKDIPVIAQTSFTFLENKEKFLSEGFDDIICKPIDSDELEKMILKKL